jgi:transposase
MTKPYSNDLRERAVGAIIAGETSRVVAARFGVAVSSVIKWHQRYRETGSVGPAKMGGHRKIILAEHRDFILNAINTTPHLTVRAMQAMLAKRDVEVSHNGVWLFLRREGLSFKKNTGRH